MAAGVLTEMTGVGWGGMGGKGACERECAHERMEVNM